MRIVFMGSPQFALPAIERLIESDHELLAVVTQPDRPAGRGRSLRLPPVSELARAHGLPILQPPRVNAQESLDALRALQPEAIVIVAYGQILKQPLLDIPSRGLLNVHASLLPRHRGAAPATAALLAGDAETGVTILEVVLALDAGPMLARRSLAISDTDTTGSLNEKLAPLSAELLIETLPAWERGELTPQPQDEALTTYAPTVRREDAIIDWSLPAADVWRRVRAYSPWPGATTSFDGEPLRILEAWPLDMRVDVDSGVVLPLPDGGGVPAGAGFAVGCGEGALAVVRAQRAGKRALSGEELLRGARGLLGNRLGG